MRIHYFPFSEQPVNVWSGGTTRQLAIYPFDAELSKRNFLFRISTATVETETSDFSKFEGYRRILMILEGVLQIDHKDHHRNHLNAFDTDTFEGSWETSARGKVKDFNLIFAKEIEMAGCSHIKLDKNREIDIEPGSFTGIYLLSGKLKIRDRIASKHDFILVESGSGKAGLLLETAGNTELILSTLRKRD